MNTIWRAVAIRIAEQLAVEGWDGAKRQPGSGFSSYNHNLSGFLDRFVFDNEEKLPLLICLSNVDRVFRHTAKWTHAITLGESCNGCWEHLPSRASS